MRHPIQCRLFASAAKRPPNPRAWDVNGDMIETGSPGCWRLAAFAVPCIQADVVVISPGGDKGRLFPIFLRKREAEDAAVEREGTLEIGHFQVNMADARAGIDGWCFCSRHGNKNGAKKNADKQNGTTRCLSALPRLAMVQRHLIFPDEPHACCEIMWRDL